MDEFRDDLKASEARQREEMRELRADMKALGENVDRLVERIANRQEVLFLSRRQCPVQ